MGDSKSLRMDNGMDNETLRNRLARAWHETYVGVEPWDDLSPAARITLAERARLALAALGLDDLDAAIERAAWVLVDALPGHGTPIHDLYGPAAEKALKAAFTATPESENTDG